MTLTELINTLRETFPFVQRQYTMTVYALAEGVTLRRVQNKDLAWEHLNPECRDDWQICDLGEPGIVRTTTIRTSTGEATLEQVLDLAIMAEARAPQPEPTPEPGSYVVVDDADCSDIRVHREGCRDLCGDDAYSVYVPANTSIADAVEGVINYDHARDAGMSTLAFIRAGNGYTVGGGHVRIMPCASR